MTGITEGSRGSRHGSGVTGVTGAGGLRAPRGDGGSESRLVTGVTRVTDVSRKSMVTGSHSIQVVDKALSQLCSASQPANKLLPRSKKIRIDGRADL